MARSTRQEQTMKRWAACAAAVLMLATFASPLPGQTAATRRVMKEKLGHAQGVLEALVTGNHVKLQVHTKGLTRATQSLGWEVLKTPEYRRYSESFLAATAALEQAADDRDLDGAVTHYMSMTLACYQCHQYVKRARIAGR
jgi:hypothetical protein